MTRRAIYRWTTLAALTVAVPGLAFSQTRPDSAAVDSVKVDSLRTRILPGFGSARLTAPAPDTGIAPWRFTDAIATSQIVHDLAGVFLRDVGEAGQPASWSYLGSDAPTEGFAVDGVPWSDPLSGSLNLALFPLEHLRSIEALAGAPYVLSGSRWNLVSHQYVTPKPYTKIRFVQQPYETIFSDGLFSQNVARSANFSFGFQRNTSKGRYANSALDAWDLRSRLRYNISDRLNISALWMYGRVSRGTNGGVEPSLTASLFDEVGARVRQDDAYEILSRTDLGLTAVASLLGDSLSPTRFSVTSTRTEREYRKLPDLFSSLNIRQFSGATRVQWRAEQAINLGIGELQVLASTETVRLDSTEVLPRDRLASSSIGAGLSAPRSWPIVPALSARFDDRWGERKLGVGADVSILPLNDISAAASFERRPRFPTVNERLWNDSLVTRTEPLRAGTEELLRGSVRWTPDSGSSIELEGFRRKETGRIVPYATTSVGDHDAVVLAPANLEWLGGTVSGSLRVWKLTLSGSVTTARFDGPDSLSSILPSVWGSWELAWQDKLFKDELEARLAVRSRFADRFLGTAPDPATRFDAVRRAFLIGRTVGFDVVAVLHIGDAYLTLAWENLANIGALRVPVYPLRDRAFILAVDWSFND